MLQIQLDDGIRLADRKSESLEVYVEKRLQEYDLTIDDQELINNDESMRVKEVMDDINSLTIKLSEQHHLNMILLSETERMQTDIDNLTLQVGFITDTEIKQVQF